MIGPGAGCAEDGLAGSGTPDVGAAVMTDAASGAGIGTNKVGGGGAASAFETSLVPSAVDGDFVSRVVAVLNATTTEVALDWTPERLSADSGFSVSTTTGIVGATKVGAFGVSRSESVRGTSVFCRLFGIASWFDAAGFGASMTFDGSAREPGTSAALCIGGSKSDGRRG